MLKVFELALYAHTYLANEPENRVRKFSKEPYIYHPLRVKFKLEQHGYYNYFLRAASLLHDTLEDTALGKERILDLHGGEKILELVIGLTSYSVQINSKKLRVERMHENLEYLKRQCDQVKLIKICDIWDNLNDLNKYKEMAAKKWLNMYIQEKQEEINELGYVNKIIEEDVQELIDEIKGSEICCKK